jgi:hypothetical protein
MNVDLQTIVHAIELNRLAAGGIDHARVSKDRRLVTSNAIDPLELPDLLRGRVGGQRKRKARSHRECDS